MICSRDHVKRRFRFVTIRNNAASKPRAPEIAIAGHATAECRSRARDLLDRVGLGLPEDQVAAAKEAKLRIAAVEGSATALSIPGISLELDVPRAPGGSTAFDEFRQLAGQFANSLGGNIVDDRRTRLSDTSFTQIGHQLSIVRKTMGDHGIPAGGNLALRLFS